MADGRSVDVFIAPPLMKSRVAIVLQAFIIVIVLTYAFAMRSAALEYEQLVREMKEQTDRHSMIAEMVGKRIAEDSAHCKLRILELEYKI